MNSETRHRPPSPSPLPCDEVELDIVAYFDGEASAPVATRARRHLDACPGCARMWRDWGDARFILHSQPVPAPPASWPAALVQRARLHALLPALFPAAPEAPQVATTHTPSGSAVVPPATLRDDILKRTTRRASAAERGEARRFELDVVAPDGEILVSSHSSALWRVARAGAVPVLAAWMLMLASSRAPQEAGRVSSDAPGARSVLRLAPGARRVANLAPASADVLASRRSASPRAATAKSAAHRVERVGPREHQQPATEQADSEAQGRAVQSAAPEITAPTSSVPAVSAMARPDKLDKPERARRVFVARRTSAETSGSVGAPGEIEGRRAVTRVAARPTVAEAASTSSTSSAREGAAPSRRGAEARPPLLREAPVALAAASRAPHAGEAEPMDVALELHDARPTELGEAVDAYAATWTDSADDGTLGSAPN
jgi:hypothetical protein